MHLESLIPWFIHYKYWVIFPIAVIEGPVITIVTGFLASLRILNLAAAFFVVLAGDLLGDMIYYYIGRYGKERFIKKYGRYIGITIEREQMIEHHFENHALKTLAVAKFAHGVGSIALAAAGLARVSPKKVLGINLVTTSVKSAILISIGYYFGKYAFKLNDYLDYAFLAVLIFGIALYYVLAKRRFFQKMKL